MPEITAPDHPVRICTTGGVSIALQANETRTVAPHIAMAAAQQGCSVQYEDKKGADAPEVDPEKIDTVVRGIISEGRTDEFNASGRPKTAAVSARLGVDVTPSDVQRSFTRVTRDKRSDTS